VQPCDSIIATPPGAIISKVSGTRMHATQPGGRNEHVHQAYVVHDSKIVSEVTELNMDKM
jgi:hypothetical protein